MVNINTVAVIGAGRMGSGIASAILVAEKKVILIDVVQEILDKAKFNIQGNLEKAYSKGSITVEPEKLLVNLTVSSAFEAVKEADLIIEAVSENMDIKKKVFSEIDKYAKIDAIIASNTSALKVSDLADFCKKPENVVGMHFFNPVMVMKLVELVKTEKTSVETFNNAREFVASLGKEPVSVKEHSGFIVNRILIPMINEAAFVFGEGIATPEDIDKAMMLGANHPIGPLALADMVGLDICLAIMETLNDELGNIKYQPAPVMIELVKTGKLGKKSGEGFFKYN